MHGSSDSAATPKGARHSPASSTGPERRHSRPAIRDTRCHGSRARRRMSSGAWGVKMPSERRSCTIVSGGVSPASTGGRASDSIRKEPYGFGCWDERLDPSRRKWTMFLERASRKHKTLERYRSLYGEKLDHEVLADKGAPCPEASGLGWGLEILQGSGWRGCRPSGRHQSVAGSASSHGPHTGSRQCSSRTCRELESSPTRARVSGLVTADCRDHPVERLRRMR